jgi:putative Ca2+/H+ antiporter (TMEM165/GDT1 family)
MDAFLSSTLIVALAEIGDKTMLLAILLACRFGKPLQIVAGILVATIANHLLAAAAGVWLAGTIETYWFQIAVAVGFIVMAAWTLIPDKIDQDESGTAYAGGSAFLVTLVAFFIAEMGDKTQVATVALGAQHQSLLWVTLGTTLGMMIANVPAVFLGDRITQMLPMPVIRIAAASVLALTGIWALWLALSAG